MQLLFSYTVESGQNLSRWDIAGSARQTSAFSAQTEQSCWVQAAAGALVAEMLHAFKLDSALKLSVLVYIYPAFFTNSFQYCLFFRGKGVYSPCFVSKTT